MKTGSHIYVTTILVFLFSVSSAHLDSRYKQNELTTYKNNTLYAFRGIRYAEPPIGELRFKDPKPNKKAAFRYLRLEDLTKEGSSCPSPYTSVINEDCLFLNVYTRNLNRRVPVVIFIHPGAFYYGSGSADYYGPEFLLEKDVVLVTFNYRLGFFGFASTGDARAPGNAGLKDQVLVLKWVQENIVDFGGDPKRVTLMGASAGGMSVGLHMVSSMSRNLFHNAIAISGAILPQTPLPHNQMHLIERQAKLLGCNGDAFDCLLHANASDIIGTTVAMFEFGTENPIYLWLPVIEGAFGQQRFLVTDPYKALLQNNFCKVPLLTGCTKDEGAVQVMRVITNTTLRNELKNDFNTIGPIWLHYQRDTNQSKSISSAIWKYYFDKGLTFTDMNNCFSDAILFMPVDRTAQILSSRTKVFYYKFTYNGIFSQFKNNTDIPTGNDTISQEIRRLAPNIIIHLDDVNYVLTSAYRQIYNLEYLDERTVERFTSLIESFARTGSPYITNERFIWPTYGKDQTFLDFGTNLRSSRNPFARSLFWKSIFP